ncbi:MAG: Asp-tRNA(Asn)/Glu-tRNA(Gln) amidotransferase GatCAB subunit B, partial [Gammaproteobacteria bacterium]
FEELLEKSSGEGKLAANWVTGDLAAALNKDGIEIEESPVTPELLAGLLKKIADKSVTSKIAKNVFEKIWSGEGSADEIVEKYGWKPVDTSSIEPLIDEIIANNPGQVEQYRGGKEKLFSFFVGQVMKATKGQADPAEVSKLLKAKLAG